MVLSINSCNYNLEKYLSELLTSFIPTAHCTKGSFIFIKDIQDVSTHATFIAS